ncbi:MAG TPA: hypothetical protein ENI23_02590 [bacterium]|nr:hypothetical protein [bacterium]
MQLDKNRQKFIKNLQNFAPKFCDNCGNAFSELDFKVLKQSNINTLLHLRCSSCGNAYMLNVLNPNHGVAGSTRVPVNLDLSHGEEIRKFAGSSAVTDNNALDAYEAFSDENIENKLRKQLNLPKNS